MTKQYFSPLPAALLVFALTSCGRALPPPVAPSRTATPAPTPLPTATPLPLSLTPIVMASPTALPTEAPLPPVTDTAMLASALDTPVLAGRRAELTQLKVGELVGDRAFYVLPGGTSRQLARLGGVMVAIFLCA